MSTWDEARAEYERLRAISDAMPLGSEGEDAAVDAYAAAMDHVINDVPAPDMAAVIWKFELGMGRARGFSDGLMEDHAEAIFGDLQRLAGAA
jgi:hypothetical protein